MPVQSARRATAAHVLLVAVAILCHLTFPAAPTPVWAAIGLVGACAVLVGVRLHRPAQRRPWWVPAGGLFTFFEVDTCCNVMAEYGAAIRHRWAGHDPLLTRLLTPSPVDWHNRSVRLQMIGTPTLLGFESPTASSRPTRCGRPSRSTGSCRAAASPRRTRRCARSLAGLEVNDRRGDALRADLYRTTTALGSAEDIDQLNATLTALAGRFRLRPRN